MTELDRFANDWYRAVSSACQAGRDSDPTAASLMPLLTTREPYRAAAEQDARLLARLYVPMGLGMQVRATAHERSPSETWQATIHPFSIELRWQDTMDVRSSESTATQSIDRIALEDGGWRVVTIFDDKQRSEAVRFAELLAAQR